LTVVGATDLDGRLIVSGITTFGSHVYHGDNDHAIFGDGSDLSIYHTGSESRIIDSGTGDLKIGGSPNVAIVNGANNSIKALFGDTSVSLNHSGNTKFTTKSTGAEINYKLDIGGPAGSPGIISLYEGGAVSEIRVTRNSDANSDLQFKTESGDGTQIRAKINYDKDFELVGNSLVLPDSIIHSGDTNTKIRFPAADTVSVETGGQQNVQVDGTRVLLKSPSGTDTTVRLQHQGNSGYGDIILDRTVNAFIISNDPNNASNNQSYFSVKNKGVENLRITSGGALLVGLTSPTYNSGDMQHEIKKNNNRTYTAPLMSAHSHLLLNNSDTTNNAFTGLGFRAGSGDGAIGYVYRGSANTADFVINTDGNGNGVERLRVFNNGSVLIGALSGEAAGGSSSSGTARLVIDCEGLNVYNGVGNAANYGLVFANDYNTNYANGIGFFNDGGTDCGGYIVHQDKGANNIGDLVFATSATADTPVERVRIKSNGEVDISDNVVIHSVGNSQAVDIEQQTDGNYMNIRLRNFYTGSAKNMMAFLDQNGNVRGSIVINNSNTTYNTSSDYRLKENEVPISDGIERLKLLKPYRFNWKDDPSITLDGFFAHEVTPAVPEAIVNEKDGEIDEEGNGYQQMDYAKITPLLTAALQEAIAEIETLKTKVAALESS